jgi:hypothetical protein
MADPFDRTRPENAAKTSLRAAKWVLIGLSLSLVAGFGAAVRGEPPAPRPAPLGVPVRFTLAAPARVTLVIEDERGNRVRNLVAETLFPAGERTVYWDGYDDGVRGGNGDLTRRRVAAGTYNVRGLTHDGIRMSYELTAYNPGQPPWATKDRSGGWLADHSPPADILYLPKGVSVPNGKGKAHFLVCSTSGEAGDEFVWLDESGRRIYGTNDGFWGGTHLARDAGTDPAPGYYAYVFESGQRDPDNFHIEVRGFKTADGQIESVLKYPRPRTLRTFKGDEEAYGSDGLAVHNGRIVLAVTMLDKLVFVDARKKKVTGEVKLASPRAPTFDAEGRLYVISEGKVKRFSVLENGARLGDERTVIDRDLEEPHRLARDDAGNLYVSDWGKSHQVKVFDTGGKLVRTIGASGGPKLGLYDERRMSHPCGVTVDGTGRIWVAEGDSAPKRLSLWKADGTFLKALYGPAKYGGGGALDPRDKTRLYYDSNGRGIEFALDWERGTSRVASIYYRPDLMTDLETMPGLAPERAFHVGGRQYMVNCYNGDLRHNQDRGTGIWRMDADRVARPVAMVGNGADLVNDLWGWRMKNRAAIVKLWEKQKAENVLFVWCDRDGDGVALPDEIQWVAEDHSRSPDAHIGGPGLMPLVHADLSVTTAYGTRIPAPKFDDRGVPLYDLAKRATVGDPAILRSPLVADQLALTNRDGDGWWQGFDLKGGGRWRYPATPEEEIGGPGAMVAPTRLLGPAVTPQDGEAGPLVAVNGEMGAIFLLTADGLFLQTLGGDARLFPPLSATDPKRNDEVKDITFQQEHFHPTINQTADGEVYLVVGYQQATVLRLDGLGSVRRKTFGPVKVEERDLAGIAATSVRPGRKQSRLTHEVSILATGPKVDGDLSDWPADTRWMTLDARTSAAVAVDGVNLYVAVRTDDPNALDNAGKDFRHVFKSGGAFDLMLGTDVKAARDRSGPVAGDVRLTVTRTDGKTAATLYRAVAPDAPKAAGVVFESPIGKVSFDQVGAVGGQVELAQVKGDYEFSVPLKALGLVPAPGKELLADVGILRGREGRTVQRVYWNNQDTVLVSDLPSEARLQPARWGVWHFR